jgi:N6-adenosine-specific RNA methylase IME4
VTFSSLNPPYSTIVADPPWHYETRLVQLADGDKPRIETTMPYSTMNNAEIAEMPVFDLAAPGAHLYLWTTNQHIWAARDIALGWGFDPSQVLVWCKPPRGFAPGGLFANTVEFIVYARKSIKAKRETVRAGALIREAREAAGINRSGLHRAVRGDTPTGIVRRWEYDDSLPNDRDWERLQQVLPALQGIDRPHVEPPAPREISRVDSSWWQWPLGRHSQKPGGFLDLVEQVSPGPYVELFARQPRLGWDAWGHGYEGQAAS